MARFQSRTLHFFILCPFILILVANHGLASAFSSSSPPDFSILDDSDSNLIHHDYSPPSLLSPPPPPPPPRPHSSSVSCTHDLDGVGSLDTTCQILSDLNLTRDVYIAGKGNFYILSGVRLQCPYPGCSITVEINGSFILGKDSSIVTGNFELKANNSSFLGGSVVNTSTFAGDPPPFTRGTPEGIEGAGGGHGGRGASCLFDMKKLPLDVWGGDTYSWFSLESPDSYGSRGGTTSKEADYGGLGGGKVYLLIQKSVVVNGSFLADGGDGGTKGGGGSGGSIYINANKMTGSGSLSACGGNGHAGGGGGRVSVDVISRQDDLEIFVHGGSSIACPNNAGAAGTLYNAFPRSLIISNHNMTTDTETVIFERINQPLMTNVYIRNKARAAVPMQWSRLQVHGQISLLSGGVLSFGSVHYASSEFELLAEELLMSNSELKVHGALRMSVEMILMWNSKLSIDCRDLTVATSSLEANNLIVLRESSVIQSNANLGVHGQGLLNLSGRGDLIQGQRLVGPGSILRGPLEDAGKHVVTQKLHCDSWDCPVEVLHPPEDCKVNSFTIQICRVEDITVEGVVKGSVVHFHRARTVAVQSSGMISASRMGCTGGVGRGNVLSNGSGSGGGHGGKGGAGCSDGRCAEGGISYGNADFPCELGSGSGNDSSGLTSGGGMIVMGSSDYPLSNLYVKGSVTADGESFEGITGKGNFAIFQGLSGGPGGGSGGTILLFIFALYIGESAILSSVGGDGCANGGGGGGGGGRIHFHWSDIPIGDAYQPIASVKGNIVTRGGAGGNQGGGGENGTVTGKACPKGLYGILCEECPAGTYKNVTGSDSMLCRHCPANELPRRAIYVFVRGGTTETPCPYRCISDEYHLPNCYTALEDLVHRLGGPWLFGLLLAGLLVLLALVLTVARMKFVGVDELPGPAPTYHGAQRDHSLPFLESLNEVLETSRAELSQSHVHRMYFLGPNTFSEPWHLPYTPPEQLKKIVYEDAFSTFVDEINAIAAYQWWEGAIYSILLVLGYPISWSWKQWCRKIKLQRLREFVRSEYDHACMRSCRSRALYEGIKVAATSDLMLAYVDFFLGGDEKRTDLLPHFNQRFPLSLLFGGDGSYMASFTLHNDSTLTNLLSQSIPATKWYRMVAGLNAHLRLVRSGRLGQTFQPVLRWLETHANPSLKIHGVRIDLAWFRATSSSYRQYGLLLYAAEESKPLLIRTTNGPAGADLWSRVRNILKENPPGRFGEEPSLSNESHSKRKKMYGKILDSNVQTLQEKRDLSYILSFILYNTKPIGHQDVVGIVISVLLLGDFSLVLLTLLQLYSSSLADVFLVLFILPLGIVLPFPAAINALFSHGPRPAAGFARIYAFGNIMSLINVVVAFVCGFTHIKAQSSSELDPSPWNVSMAENGWWILPTGLVFCKLLQSRLINWHVANLEVQDRSLYSTAVEIFWQS